MRKRHVGAGPRWRRGIAIDLLFASTSVSQRANIYVIRTETE
jgi:hypothetical protein